MLQRVVVAVWNGRRRECLCWIGRGAGLLILIIILGEIHFRFRATIGMIVWVQTATLTDTAGGGRGAAIAGTTLGTTILNASFPLLLLLVLSTFPLAFIRFSGKFLQLSQTELKW